MKIKHPTQAAIIPGGYMHTIAHLLVGTLSTQPLSLAAAELNVDTNAAAQHQAGLTQAGNGTQVVNIVAPDQRGLSHNKYSDFNVGQQGLIFNNATQAGQSQLGGAVLANPNLRSSGSSASVILNEVTGTRRSTLLGFQEIFGQRADLILANPNGITCNGCGFINTPRASLTTGRPRILDGRFDGFDVRRGDILIEGAGLNARGADTFDLVSRSVQIRGPLHGRGVRIFAGSSDFDYTSATATAVAGDGSSPQYLVDTSALGGVFAERIYLVGTEAGIGVRVRGDMAATVDDITIDSAGRIELSSTASTGMRARGDIALLAQNDLDIDGYSVTAEKSLDLNAAGRLTVSATDVVAHNALDMMAGSVTVRDGRVTGGGPAQVSAAGQVSIENAVLGGATRLDIQAASVAVDASNISGKGLLAGIDMTLDVGSAIENDGDIRAGGQLNITRGQLVNRGTVSASGVAAGDVDNYRNLFAGTDGLDLTGDIHNRPGANILALGDINLGGVGRVVTNERGLIESYQGDIFIQGTEFFNLGQAPVVTSTTTTQTGGTFTYSTGSGTTTLPVYGDCGTTSDNFDVSREGHRCARSVTVITETIAPGAVPDPARLLAAGDITINTGHEVRNRYSLIAAAGDVTITTDRFTNQGARLTTLRSTAPDSKSFATAWTYSRGRETTWAGEPCFSSPERCYADGILGAVAVVKNFAEIRETVISQSEPAAGWGGSVQAGNTLTIIANSEIRNGDRFADTAPVLGDPGSAGSPGDTQVNLPDTGTGPFVRATDPSAHYLIETRPEFGLEALLQGFGGSLFLLDELRNNPDLIDETSTHAQLLGDAFFETQSVRDQVITQSGLRFIYDGLSSDVGQFQQLMANAVDVAGELELRPGVALDADQLEKLNKDIVWMVEVDVDGRKALAPKVYLTEATLSRLGRGERLVAKNIDLSAQSIANNAGTIHAGERTRLSGGTILNQAGNLSSGGGMDVNAGSFINRRGEVNARSTLVVTTKGDLLNQSGSIRGGDVSLTSTEGDIINETLAHRTHDSNTKSYTTVTESTGQIAAGNSLSMDAAGNIELRGADAEAGGHVVVRAGGDIVLTYLELEDVTETKTLKREGVLGALGVNTSEGVSLTIDRRLQGSTLSAAGGIDMQSASDTEITASRLSSENGAIRIQAEGDVTIGSAKSATTTTGRKTTRSLFGAGSASHDEGHSVSASGSIYREQTTTTYDKTEKIVGSTLSGAGGVDIVAGERVTLISVDADAKQGDISITGQAVDILADTTEDIHSTRIERLDVGAKAGAGSKETYVTLYGEHTDTADATTRIAHQGSRLGAGGNVRIISKSGDVREQATQIEAGGDIGLSAQGGSVVSEAVKDKETRIVTADGYRGELGAGVQTGIVEVVANELRDDKDGNLTVGDGMLYKGARLSYKQENKRGVASDESLKTSRFRAGGNLNIGADLDVVLHATQMETGADISLQAGNDVMIKSVAEIDELDTDVTKAGGDLVGTKNAFNLTGDYGRARDNERVSLARTSNLNAGGDLSVRAGRDIDVEGAQGGAGGNVNLQADGDVNLRAARDTYRRTKEKTQIDGRVSYDNMNLGEGQGRSRGAGVEAQVSTGRGDEQLSQVRTAGFGAAGDLGIHGGKNVVLEGTQLDAAGDGAIVAERGDVQYKAARNTYSITSDDVRVHGKVSGAKGSKAGGTNAGLKDKVMGFKNRNLSNPAYKYNQQGDADINHEETRINEAVSGSFNFGGDALVQAGGDIRLQGTQGRSGDDVTIDAGSNVYLESAVGTASVDDSTKKFGVGIGQTGFTSESTVVTATTHQASRITAGGRVSARSGNDTRINGGVIEGEQVSVDVGGDLVVESEVDTLAYDARDQGAIAGVRSGMHIGNTSNQGEITTVTTPSGIRSRSGTQVDVKGVATLKGGHVLQEYGAATLDSQTLVTEDVQANSQVRSSVQVNSQPGSKVDGVPTLHDSTQTTRSDVGTGGGENLQSEDFRTTPEAEDEAKEAVHMKPEEARKVLEERRKQEQPRQEGPGQEESKGIFGGFFKVFKRMFDN